MKVYINITYVLYFLIHFLQLYLFISYMTALTGKSNSSDAKYKHCHMLCLNAPGNYCSPDRYKYSSTDHLRKPIALPSSPVKEHKVSRKQDQPFVIGTLTFKNKCFSLEKLSAKASVKLR